MKPLCLGIERHTTYLLLLAKLQTRSQMGTEKNLEGLDGETAPENTVHMTKTSDWEEHEPRICKIILFEKFLTWVLNIIIKL